MLYEVITIDESSIAPFVDAGVVAAFVKEKLGGTCPVVKTHKRLASEDGVALIKADVDSGELDAVLICGSSPRVDWDVYSFGDKVLVERVNLREQAVLSYKNPDGTKPAGGEEAPEELKLLVKDYVKMGVMKLRNNFV